MQLDSWLTFCSIAFIATATPGPAVLLVTTTSIQFGILRSLITIAGNVTGLFIMSACSVLGLSALVLYSSTAFTAIKILGACYLLYLGIKLWRNGINTNITINGGSKTSNVWNLYSHGLLIALTNPKAIAFTTALFPQFISVSKPLLPQFTILVVTFMAFSFSCLLFFSIISQKIKHNSKTLISGKVMGRIFGSIFIGASAVLATT